MIERTLVLVKPDGIKRGLTGEIIKRFEQRGLKIIGMKMVQIDKGFAEKHYTEDLARRRGEKIREININFLQESPVVAVVLEGVNAIDNVRKIVGDTEPKSALPGTIRGDFCHISYDYANKGEGKAIRNIVHASANKKDAEYEIKLWFNDDEMYSYKFCHEEEVF